MTQNPYQAPQESPQELKRETSPQNWTLLFVPMLMLIATGCALGAVMAIYEVVSLRPNAYGQHTNTFRMSYVRTATACLGLLAASVMGTRLLVRHQRAGLVIAVVVVSLVLWWMIRSLLPS